MKFFKDIDLFYSLILILIICTIYYYFFEVNDEDDEDDKKDDKANEFIGEIILDNIFEIVDIELLSGLFFV